MAIIKDSQIEGRRVILEDGADVGTVNDIYVDTSDWRVTRIDVKLEKRYAEHMGLDPGIIKKKVIPVKIHFLLKVGDVVRLKGELDDLARSQKTIFAKDEMEAPKPKAAPPPKAAPKEGSKPAPKPAAKSPPKTPPKEEKKPRSL